MQIEDRAIIITEMALAKKDSVCEETLDIFVSVLGANAGDLVLRDAV